MGETSEHVVVAYGMPKRTPRKFPFVEAKKEVELKPTVVPTAAPKKEETSIVVEPTISSNVTIKLDEPPVVSAKLKTTIEKKENKAKKEPVKEAIKEPKKKEAKKTSKKNQKK